MKNGIFWKKDVKMKKNLYLLALGITAGSLLACQPDISESYGEPIRYNSTTFLESCPDFEVFLAKYEAPEDRALGVGDIYHIEGDREVSLSLRYDDTIAIAEFRIYRYQLR